MGEIKDYTYNELAKKIMKTEIDLAVMKENLIKICPHNNIYNKWLQDHESSTFQGVNYLTCQDCNLSGNDNQGDVAVYSLLSNILRKNVR